MEERSLKQKWADHWENKKTWSPQDQANLAGILFFWGFTFSLMFTTLFFAIPHHHKDNERYDFWAKGGVYFIFVQCATNWFLCVIKKSNATSSKSVCSQNGDKLPTDWNNCILCQVNVPPRSFHCKLCNTCVLKRDHHCFFTGVCVGFDNQRHFIVYVFYVMIGSIYGTYLISHYLGHYYDVQSHEGWTFVPFVAMWQVVMSDLALEHFLLLCQMYMCIVMAIVGCYFFLWQLSVVMAGRTTYEVRKGIRKYKGKNVVQSIYSVFGPFWPIQFIFPYPSSLPGNGTSWDDSDVLKWQ